MNISMECLDDARVESLLQGNLNPHQNQLVQDHLEFCEHCRSRVEATIGPQQWWDDIQSVLLNSQDSLVSREQVSIKDAEPNATLTPKLLDLLGPTDDPNMLGRIGPYEIIGLLGQGGMGAVFKGFDRSLNRFVAIKMLLPHLAASGAARQRFAREAQAVAAVVDDHVMAIHCVDQWLGVPYLVMTYLKGVSLQKRLSDNGPLEVCKILRIGMQAAKGLAAAHAQGIVHRDIKPANIFLDQNVDRAQLMDFGLARAVDDASLTCSGTLAGTPQYMSPEQARAETVDHRSDLFSLGSVMYAMCTGHAPFRAESSYGVLRLITDTEARDIREINSEIPGWLCAIVSKMMAKQAGDRFDAAAHVAELLEQCLAHVQQPSSIGLPRSVRQLSRLHPVTGRTTNPWIRGLRRFFYTPTPIGKLAAAIVSLTLIIAGVLLSTETSKVGIPLERNADNVQIRIMQGEDIVKSLTLNNSHELTRLQAGEYTFEIEGTDDERQDRCEAGSQFLNDSRIDQWEKVFTEGIRKMGKIVVTMRGKVATEAWFEDEYHLFRHYETGNHTLVQFWNREYGGTIDVSGNKNPSTGTSFPPPAGNINVAGLPFAISSSVDFTNELIPIHLKEGKLRIYDYRVDGSQHIFDLQHTDGAKEGFIELVFDDAVDSLLPKETIFHKGTSYPRHFVNTDFADIAGLKIPLQVAELNTDDLVTTTIFPQDRLDKKMCWFSYYGLPEPDGMAVTDFGRNSQPWGPRISAIAAFLLAAAIGGWLWRRREKAS